MATREALRAYVGQCRGDETLSILRAHGIGDATQRGEFPPRRMPYFFDNGAFSDWMKKRDFREHVWRADLAAIREEGPTPDFVVLPDRVAEASSLQFSLSFVPLVRDVAPMALVVQDGMDEAEVSRAIQRHGIDVLFVGGSLEWKLTTGGRWVQVAHSIGRRCHIGRVGTAPRVKWAREIKADSIDSCTPLWSKENLRRFLSALQCEFQAGLFGAIPPPPRESWRKRPIAEAA